jgi:hypothetical protein
MGDSLVDDVGGEEKTAVSFIWFQSGLQQPLSQRWSAHFYANLAKNPFGFIQNLGD